MAEIRLRWKYMHTHKSQYWEPRLIYIYALLGGYLNVNTDKTKLTTKGTASGIFAQNFCIKLLLSLDKNDKLSIKQTLLDKDTKLAKGLDNKYASSIYFPVAEIATNLVFKIEDIDVQWFRENVDNYIQSFMSNSIFIPSGDKIRTYEDQRSAILDRVSKSSFKNYLKLEQAKDGFYGLEVLLGLQKENILSITELESLVPTRFDFINRISAKITLNKNTDFVTKPTEHEHRIAEAKIDDKQIYIGFKGEELIPLGNQLREQGPYYNFMHYMQSHTNKSIAGSDIRDQVEGCSIKKDMTELVRNCHFNKELKSIFFEGTTKTNVIFTPQRKLGGADLEAFKNILISTVK